MPTTKKRINLTVDEQLYRSFERLCSYKNSTSVSALVLELAQKALELEEDLYFIELAQKRSNEEEISHSVLWSKL
jgi:metal-responsive CopG/Arc/MetJ family transcriptional regulator